MRKKILILEKRTVVFGENIINFCRKINQDVINKPIINQSIRFGTSMGEKRSAGRFMEGMSGINNDFSKIVNSMRIEKCNYIL